MKLAGVDAKTPDVPGGVIVRDASGNPTGIFKDAAMPLIYKAIPPMTHEQRLRAARGALKHAASLGVTSVQHMNPEFADVAAYSELAEKGELTTRIYAVPMETDWRDQAKVGFVARGARVICDSARQRLCRWLVRLANRLHVRAVYR
jgi:Predicted metal-dependent hydrolase with the TIM-barrel fold